MARQAIGKVEMEFLSKHWTVIALSAVIGINLLQAVTRHFGDHKGVKRVALFLVDVLSIFPSGVGLKLPLTTSEKKDAA